MDELSRDELVHFAGQLQAQLAERDAVIAMQQERLELQQGLLETLSSEVKLLKRALFGNRRERFVDDPRQGTLFDSQWVGPEPDPSSTEETSPPTKRKKGGKRGFQRHVC